jgi:hypothetical protein
MDARNEGREGRDIVGAPIRSIFFRQILSYLMY